MFGLEDDDATLLNSVGDVSDIHALILGEHGLELMCALIRRGCATAAVLRLNEKPDAQTADLVVVPHATCSSVVEQALRQAQRAMVPGGRIVLRIGKDPTGRITKSIKQALRTAGVGAVRGRAHRRRTLQSVAPPPAGAVLCS